MRGHAGAYVRRWAEPVCRAVLAGAAAVLLAGCGPRPNVPPDMRALGQAPPYLYSDQDWATVLRDYVHNGAVDYSTLSKTRQPLDRYYALLSVTGPTQTADQFPSPAHRTAYWVNAYNALVLTAVLQRYPIETLYDYSLPRLESDYTFRVDGRLLTLAQIENLILQASDGDVRALFATSRASLGTPRLSGEPIRPTMLERQLTEAAADALNNPKLLRIDHAGRSVLVWQLVLGRQEDFLHYWRTRRRAQGSQLLSVLLDLASAERRRALQGAVGYSILAMPYDRALNSWPPVATGGTQDGGRQIVP